MSTQDNAARRAKLTEEGKLKIADLFPRVHAIADQLDSDESNRLMEVLARMADQSSGDLVFNMDDSQLGDVAAVLSVLDDIAKKHDLYRQESAISSRGGPPSDAMDMDVFTDADDNTVLLTVPTAADQPIAVAVIEGANLADLPQDLVVLWPDQAIALGQALVRAGIRKQVVAEFRTSQ
jgi:hypothetical protein